MLPMKELTVEEAKKELSEIVEKSKTAKAVELSAEEKASIEAEKKQKEELKKKDEEILKKQPEALNEEEKKRRDEILEGKKAEEEEKVRKLSPEEKIKRVEAKAQKRIDEVVSKLKQVEDSSSKEAQNLRQELINLREEKNNLERKISETLPKDDKLILKKKEEELIRKYIEEDKELPREERREMSREELENWLIEDNLSAQEWLSERALRRKEEKEKLLAKETETGASDESIKRVSARHPELSDTIQIESRLAELKKESKSDKEIGETLLREFPKHVISLQIVREWQKSKPEILKKPNAPELVAEEMEKRISGFKNQEFQS